MREETPAEETPAEENPADENPQGGAAEDENDQKSEKASSDASEWLGPEQATGCADLQGEGNNDNWAGELKK